MFKDDRMQARGSMFRVAVLVAVSLAATGFLLRRQSDPPPTPAAAAAPSAIPYFRDWPKPDVALVLSGQQHGYLQPCGCTRPQYGGLARRFNLISQLRERGWPVVALDVGDVAAGSSQVRNIHEGPAAHAVCRRGHRPA